MWIIYLCRLESSPDERRKAGNLRGNRYEVVPPVREPRKPESRYSWELNFNVILLKVNTNYIRQVQAMNTQSVK